MQSWYKLELGNAHDAYPVICKIQQSFTALSIANIHTSGAAIYCSGDEADDTTLYFTPNLAQLAKSFAATSVSAPSLENLVQISA